MTNTIAKMSPRLKASLVGIYYVLTALLGTFVLLFDGRLAFRADLIAIVFYVVLTIVFHDLSKPAGGRKDC
jgi:hypothetical protein